MSDLLLVNPLFLHEDPVEQKLMTPYFPLGLLYLAAAARDAGYSVSIFDAMFQPDDDSFATTLQRENPKVVGIGILATVRGAALRLAELAHQHGAAVIVGGADPTGRPESYLKVRSNGHHIIDLVVVGEGEKTLLQLLPLFIEGRPSHSQLDIIEGLAYLDAENKCVSTAPRPHNTELDRLPLPARDLIDLEAYRRAWKTHHGYFSLSLIATRGCPYGCSWCQKSVFGRSFRPRDPKAVASEIKLVKERYQPEQVRIVDDVMGIDRRWVRDWHRVMLENDAVLAFECLSRVDLMDEEMVRLLKEAGCQRIAFGAESGSQKVLDAMNKGTTVDQIRQAAALCRSYGIETYFYIMLGYPGEEWADLIATVDLLKETRPDMFSSTIAYPLPGTEFYDSVQHRLLDSPNWDYTAENRLLFRREYSTRFYQWVQRWLHQAWRVERQRHGEEQASPAQRLRSLARLWIARGTVEILRRTDRAGAKGGSSSPTGQSM